MKFVFLSYLNRSGSTFLVNQLSKLPALIVCPEADILYDQLLCNPNEILLPEKSAQIISKLQKDKKFSVWRMNLQNFESFSGTCFGLFQQILLAFVMEHAPKAHIVLFKHNYLYRLFPLLETQENILFLSLLRHPAAIYSSQTKTISPATGRVMSRNPLALIDQWNSLLQFVLSTGKSESHVLVLYEELVEKPDETMHMLCKVLMIQEKWSDLLHKRGKVGEWLGYEYMAIHQSIDKKPIVEKIDNWKLELGTTTKNLLARKMSKNSFYNFPANKERHVFLICYSLFCRFDRKFLSWKQNIKHLIQHGV
ncbi:MAG: sulfotransferase [Bacteroidota bacterium]|nr:MAG: sulfotransferase [Bacteroidota bacterium]